MFGSLWEAHRKGTKKLLPTKENESKGKRIRKTTTPKKKTRKKRTKEKMKEM